MNESETTKDLKKIEGNRTNPRTSLLNLVQSPCGTEHESRVCEAVLEFNPDNMKISGVHVGDYAVLTDGVIWSVFHKGSVLDDAAHLIDLETALSHLADAIMEEEEA